MSNVDRQKREGEDGVWKNLALLSTKVSDLCVMHNLATCAVVNLWFRKSDLQHCKTSS